jgi:hypothetical protein
MGGNWNAYGETPAVAVKRLMAAIGAFSKGRGLK